MASGGREVITYFDPDIGRRYLLEDGEVYITKLQCKFETGLGIWKHKQLTPDQATEVLANLASRNIPRERWTEGMNTGEGIMSMRRLCED